jgi:hypothetical protein
LTPGIFFQGVTARVLYQAPSTAIAWSVYEFIKYYLNSRSSDGGGGDQYETLSESAGHAHPKTDQVRIPRKNWDRFLDPASVLPHRIVIGAPVNCKIVIQYIQKVDKTSTGCRKRCRGPFLTSPLGANFDPRGKFVPQG